MKIKVASLFSGIGGFEMGLYDALGKENVYHAWNVLDSSERKEKLVKNNMKRKKVVL